MKESVMADDEASREKRASGGQQGRELKKHAVLPRDFRAVPAIDPYSGKVCDLYVRDNTITLTAKKGLWSCQRAEIYGIGDYPASNRRIPWDDGDMGW